MKRNRFIYILLLSFFALSGKICVAQDYNMSVKIDKDTILIGEQTKIHIEAKIPESVELIFPEYKDTLSKTTEILINSNHSVVKDGSFNIYKKEILITSFDTGLNVIPYIPVKLVENSDTNFYTSAEIRYFVKPFVILDTIPVDTIYSNRSGNVVFGKDGFKKEIEQYIPDSIKQSVSTDSLEVIKEGLKDQLMGLFSSELTKQTGMYDQDEIFKIAEASEQMLFVIDKEGIAEEFRVYGSVDTVFVQEFQQVQQGTALFTLYKIKDINETMHDTPFNMDEFWYYFKLYLKKYWWILAIVIAALLGLVYFLVFYRKGKKPVLFKLKPDLPAHIIALEKLENIRKEKVWSKGQIKLFHVQVTDTIREYLDNRFGIYAMEMTSSEILDTLTITNYIDEVNLLKIRQMLELADAVKFAKYEALQNENDLSIRNAFEFVESTKEEIEEDAKHKKLEAEVEITEGDSLNDIENADKTE